MRGTIKWFSANKGFGWIVLADGEEVYVHSSALRSALDAQDLHTGTAVELEIIQGPGGRQAIRVRPEDRAGR